MGGGASFTFKVNTVHYLFRRCKIMSLSKKIDLIWGIQHYLFLSCRQSNNLNLSIPRGKEILETNLGEFGTRELFCSFPK